MTASEKLFIESDLHVRRGLLKNEKTALHSFLYKNLFYKNIEAKICKFLRIF